MFIDAAHDLGLRNPAVIMALGGWADAADAGVDMIDHLIDHYPGHDIGEIADEKYFDFQQYRPITHNEEADTWVEWPTVQFRVLHHPDRDLVVVIGPEPHLLWRSLAGELLETISSLCPSVVVLLGALLTDTPHSRELPVGIYSGNADIREKMGASRLEYCGPSGLLGVLSVLLDEAEIPTVQAWASVPHYVTDSPNPKAQLALLRTVEDLLGLALDHGSLEGDAEAWTEGVDEATQADPMIREYIDQLEEATDQQLVEDNSGDRIAAEIEKYLRGR